MNKKNDLKQEKADTKDQSFQKLLSNVLASEGHPQPHDLGVRRTLIRIYILKLLCQMIFAKANKKLEQIINWDTIELYKSDIVGKKESRSDFAVNVNFKNPDYKATILLFFEHLSHLDPKAMFRLLDYHAGFYSQEKNKNRLVFSIVISQGVSGEKWNLPLTFQGDMLAKGILPQEYLDILGEYLVNFRTFLFDLQKTEISSLNPILRPIFYVFKHIKKAHFRQPKEVRDEFLKDVYRLIANVAEEMKVSPEIQEIFKDLRRTSKEFANLSRDDIIRYIIIDELEDIALYLMQYNPGMTDEVLKGAYKAVLIEKGGKDYMNELDFTREGAKIKGIEIGLKEGLETGRQEGRQEGILAGKQDIISRLLKADMDVQKICEITDLPEQEILKIQSQLKEK